MNECKTHPDGCWCNVTRAFAALGLGIACADKVPAERWPAAYTTEVLDDDKVVRLSIAIVQGQVTVIVPNPVPYRFVFWRSQHSGAMRAVFGIWHKPAEWTKTRAPVARVMLTAEEAGLDNVELPPPPEEEASS